jgi:NTE family protein
MKVGLVLGAGGVMGGAWLTGGLEALARETGWDPGSADYIVGTSAGSVMGSLLAAGVPPWFMVAHSAGEVFDGVSGPDGRAAKEADRSGGGVFRVDRRVPRIGPGSLALIRTALARPGPRTATAVICGLLPEVMI